MTLHHRLLPNLFIAGAARAGTTTLHNYLASHPSICMSPNKEPNYLWRPDRRLEDYAKLFGQCRDRHQYRGESSTSYMVLPEVALTIRDLLPEARLIFLLRNPVDRAWSHYWWAKGVYGQEGRDFRMAFMADTVKAPSSADFGESVNRLYYQTGRYSTWLATYLEVLGPHRMLLLTFEDLVSDALSVLNAISQFLQIEPFPAVPSIHRNQTTIVEHRRLLDLHASLMRTTGRIAFRVVPGAVYRRAARASWAMRAALVKMSPKRQPPPMPAEDRRWTASFYWHDVERLERMSNLQLRSRWVDFQVSRVPNENQH